MDDPFIPAELRGTSLENSILALDSIYARAENAMNAFRRASGIDCLPGCGECCKGFEPDIRPAEAAYLAAWLQGPGADKIRLLENQADAGTCPFFDADDPRHCQVYPARFLICRLFGYCAMRGKEGQLDFSLCFALDRTGRFPRKRWNADQLETAFKALPPIMSDFGSQAAAVDPEGISRPLPVRQAMSVVLDKVGLAIKMGSSAAAGRSAETDSKPDPEDRCA
jgi:Fe-S-cluster containining protein